MKVVKNALAYISRKRTRTIIVLTILTVILSSLYVCLDIIKSTRDIEKLMYKASNSSFYISKKEGGKNFQIREVAKVYSLQEVQSYHLQFDAFANLVDGSVVKKEEGIKRDDIPDHLKNIVSLQALTDSAKNTLFYSGVFNLKEGRNITEKDTSKALIHEELAKKNNLNLGDLIKLNIIDPGDKDIKSKEETFEIIGIYSGQKQENYTGLSSDLSENLVFIDYKTSQTSLGIKEKEELVSKITLFTNSSMDMEKAIKKTENMKLDQSKYEIDTNANNFEDIFNSVEGLKYMFNIMTYLIMIGGSMVLSLILIFWIRERIYEIGILLSIGFRKSQIIFQFIFELFIISIPASLISFLTGSWILDKTKSILSQGINIDKHLSNKEYEISTLISFFESYTILLLIIILSVLFASSIILIKKPKEILTKIS